MEQRINKKEFIDLLAEKNGITKKDARAVVEQFVEGVATVLANKDDLALAGFATFKSVFKEAHDGVVAATGQQFHVPAQYRHTVKLAKELRSHKA